MDEADLLGAGTLDRVKAALALAAEALAAVKTENVELRTRLEQYESRFGALEPEPPRVGSLNLTVLERKRKGAPAGAGSSAAKAKDSKSRKVASAVQKAVTTAWGGGPAVAFADDDEEEEEGEDDGAAASAAAAAGKSKGVKRTKASGKAVGKAKAPPPQPKKTPAAAARGKKAVASSSDSDDEDDEDDDEYEGESESDQESDEEEEDDDDEDDEEEDEDEDEDEDEEDESSQTNEQDMRQPRARQTREQGWADVSHFTAHLALAAAAVPAPAAASDEPDEPSLRATALPAQGWSIAPTEPTVLQLLQGVTRDNFLSCAAVLSTIPHAAVATNVQTCLPRIAKEFGGGVPSADAQAHPLAASAIFSPALCAKLELIAHMLAAIATRTDAGPELAHALLVAMRLRAVAAVRRDLRRPLQSFLCGGGRGERKPLGPSAAAAAAAAAAASQDGGETEGEGGMVTQADLAFSDSDEDEDEDEGKGSSNSKSNKSSQSAAAASPVLSVDEMGRAALAFVLLAASLRCGLPASACDLLQDLACLSPGVTCIATTLGALAALGAAGGAAGLRAAGVDGPTALVLGSYAAHLGAHLHLSGDEEGGEKAALRSGLLALASRACAQVAAELVAATDAATAAVAGIAEQELSIRSVGALSSLVAPGSAFGAAFEAVGVSGVASQAQSMLQLLADSSAGTNRALEALRGAEFDPLQAPATPAEATETLVLAAFRHHWEPRLNASSPAKACAALSQAAGAFSSLQLFLCAVFGREFDVMAGGWRLGPSGQGQALADRITERVVRGWEALREADGVAAVARPVAPPEAESVALALFAFTSAASPERLLQATALDARLRPDMRDVSADLVVLLAAAALERWHFLALCSARALLGLVLPTRAAGDAQRQRQVAALVERLARFLCAAPSFWCQARLRADVAREVQAAAAALLAHPPAYSVPRELTTAVVERSARLPVFVINLDRRADRFRRCLQAAEAHELLLMRVSAVDGKAIEAATERGGAGSGPGAGGGIALSQVRDTWDSRLNSQFDHQCQPNASAPFTNSERACAASHLLTWRVIQSIRAQLGYASDAAALQSPPPAPLPLPPPQLPPEMAERAAAFRECLRGRDDWYVIFEDDASINTDLARLHGSFQIAVQRVVRSAPPDCDVLYLGWAMPWGRATISRANEWLLRTNYAWQLHAYVLRGRAVDKLLAHLPIDAPLDNFVARLVNQDVLAAYAMRDKLVNQEGSYTQRQGDSDIRHSARTA